MSTSFWIDEHTTLRLNKTLASNEEIQEAVRSLPEDLIQRIQILIFDGALLLQQLPNISNFCHLQKLSLRKCHDLTHLGGLPHTLKTLDLSYCIQLCDLPDLSSLSIERLALEGDNEIESINLASTRIKELNIRGLRISSLPILPSTIERLYLGKTHISASQVQHLSSRIHVDWSDPDSSRANW